MSGDMVFGARGCRDILPTPPAQPAAHGAAPVRRGSATTPSVGRAAAAAIADPSVTPLAGHCNFQQQIVRVSLLVVLFLHQNNTVLTDERQKITGERA